MADYEDIIKQYLGNPNDTTKGSILSIIRDNPKIIDDPKFARHLCDKTTGIKLYLGELTQGLVSDKVVDDVHPWTQEKLNCFLDMLKRPVTEKFARSYVYAWGRDADELKKILFTHKNFDMDICMPWRKHMSWRRINELLDWSNKYSTQLLYHIMKRGTPTNKIRNKCVQKNGYFTLDNTRMTALHYAIINKKTKYIQYFEELGEDATMPIYINGVKYSLPEYFEKSGKDLSLFTDKRSWVTTYDCAKSVSPDIDHILLNPASVEGENVPLNVVLTMLIKLGPHVLKKYNLQLGDLDILQDLRVDLS